MPDYTIRAKGAARSTEIDLDDGIKYHLDHVQTSWGRAQQPEPVEEQNDRAPVTWLPHEEAWLRRTIRLVGIVECSGINDKEYKRSTLTRLLRGPRTLRLKGWEIDVIGLGFDELPETKKTPMALGFDATFYATPPFWRHAAPLNAIARDSLLYPDFGLPMQETMPPFLFARTPAAGEAAIAPIALFAWDPHFTITNWGTAFCYPSIAISGAGAFTELYLKGLGRYRVRVPLTAGAGTVTPSSLFYLDVGDNPIRLEDAAGTGLILTGNTTLRLDFGATQYRYL